jgi:hypothetical protein
MKLLHCPIYRIRYVISFVWQMLQHIIWYFSSIFRSKQELVVEIIALRNQLALYELQQEKGINHRPEMHA